MAQETRVGFRLLGRRQPVVAEADEARVARAVLSEAPSTEEAAETEPVSESPAAEADADANDSAEAWPMEEELRARPTRGDPTPATVDTTAAPTPPEPAAVTSAFLSGMTRAMRAAAQAERERALAALHSSFDAAVESTRSAGTTGAAELKRIANEEIADIRRGTKAEIARIEEESAARVASRKEQLAGELEEHEARTAELVDALRSGVRAYEEELDTLFQRLEATDDPVEIARLAAAVPEPPQLESQVLDEAWTREESATTEEEPGEEAPAEEAPTEGAVDVLVDEPPGAVTELQTVAETGEAEASGEMANTSAETTESVAEAALEDTEATRKASAAPVMEAEPTAVTTQTEGEGEAPEAVEGGEETTPVVTVDTTLHVRGLSGIAAIAGYKWQLAALDGVTAAGVSSGTEGELIFRVSHVPDVSIEQAVAGLSWYSTEVERSEPGEVWVTVRERG